MENQKSALSALIIGACLLIGLVVAGYFIGRGTARFKSDARTVTVIGADLRVGIFKVVAGAAKTQGPDRLIGSNFLFHQSIATPSRVLAEAGL